MMVFGELIPIQPLNQPWRDMNLSKKSFPKWLKAWRARMGVSQREAAELLCVSYKTLTHWEQGRSSIWSNAIMKLATYIEENREVELPATEEDSAED